ncbi:MAG: hypothetical protein JXA35_06280 [Deltaproteobacteria bacterium]|nr:hypothetical protein [Deltaproteobacteria bacterium]
MSWLFAVALSVTCCEASAISENEVVASQIAVIVSQNIRPYIEALEGLTSEISRMDGVKEEVFFLDKFEGKALVDLSRKLGEKGFDLFIAIGPHAARFVWKDISSNETPRFYSMVLNPEKVLDILGSEAGIPLNLSTRSQVEMIHAGIPFVKRLGLIFDPEYNLDFFNKAFKEAALINITIIPLVASSRKDIPLVLNDHWKDIDALWFIPDRTVISESIVEYVIKEALFNRIPVIGYNRFFYESGAALAFIFDYREIGRQCAKEAIRLLSEKDVKKTDPVFNVWVNRRVMKSLAIETDGRFAPPLDYGP